MRTRHSLLLARQGARRFHLHVDACGPAPRTNASGSAPFTRFRWHLCSVAEDRHRCARCSCEVAAPAAQAKDDELTGALLALPLTMITQIVIRLATSSRSWRCSSNAKTKAPPVVPGCQSWGQAPPCCNAAPRCTGRLAARCFTGKTDRKLGLFYERQGYTCWVLGRPLMSATCSPFNRSVWEPGQASHSSSAGNEPGSGGASQCVAEGQEESHGRARVSRSAVTGGRVAAAGGLVWAGCGVGGRSRFFGRPSLPS